MDSEKSTFGQINGAIVGLMKMYYVTVIDWLMKIEISINAKYILKYIYLYFATMFNSVAITEYVATIFENIDVPYD